MATRKQLLDRWKQEPWLSVDRRINEFFAQYSNRSPDESSTGLEELANLLVGLPFREEVQHGRDFRGSSFLGASNITIREADFSFCPNVGGLERVEFHQVHLNHIRGGVYSVTGLFVEASFVGAKLRNAWLDRSRFERCTFQDADLGSANFRGSDLRGSNFQNANCSGADFQECDLRGCDFRGVDLSGAMFRAVTLDQSTDLRGARLYDLVHEEQRNFSGQLVMRATDWRQATYDETTIFGSVPGALDMQILKLIVTAAKREHAPWAKPLADEAKRLRDVVKRNPDFRWYEALLDSVEPAHLADAMKFIERASMEL